MSTYIKFQDLGKRALGAAAITSLLVFASACSQPESFIKNNVDNFTIDTVDSYTQAKSLLQADYLISVDFSWSMSGGCTNNTNCPDAKTAKLFDSLDTFTNALVSKGIDYRIGLVRGSKQSTTNTADSDFISGLVIDSTFSGSLKDLVRARLGAVGKPLEGNRTAVVEATNKVLMNRGSEFLRDAAQLVVLFITDNDDEEYTAAQMSQIRAMKSDASYLSVRSVLTGIGANCYTDNMVPTGGNDNAYGEKYGTRVVTATNFIDPSGTPKTACILNNFASIMDNVARTISRQTKRFKLQVPNPDVSSIKVYVNGSLVPSTDYDYMSATNEIVFEDAKKPDPEAQLRLEYDQNYVLSSTPTLQTMVVTVDGSVISQSSSNGWSYDSAKNRIQFHGSAKPANGSKVQVTYRTGSGA